MPHTKPLYRKVEKYLADGTTGPEHYVAAVVVTVLAAGLQAWLKTIWGPGHSFILLYPAVFAAAWFGGVRPGLLSVALSVGFIFWLFFPEGSDLRVFAPLAVFVICGVAMSLLMGVMHQMVTRLRSMHKELHEQHEWFRITLKSIGDAVIVTDRNGAVRFMNGEAERLTGWESAEAFQKPLRSIFRIISEESRKTVDDPVEKVFRERRVVGLANHTLLISKSGVEWPIEDSASPIHDESDIILGVVLCFHDATELRRNQRSLKAHADELEHKVFQRTVALQRTVNDLEAFSYSISHDLRSPLRAMLGYSQALLEDFPNLPALATDYLQKVARSAERLDHLVQDLLEFSRISHDEESIAPVEFIDNGIGIAPENQERIFKMFEQINPKGRYGGTGIGLAVVKKAVEKMQGSLGVESTEGQGSKFWIELLKAKTP